MKVLNFELFGDFAHFRPYYTTSSPTTYTIIPPTTAVGVIGAILGLDKEEYSTNLKDKGIRIGIGLKNIVKKLTLSINLVNTKGNYWIPTKKNTYGPRTPTRYEYLKEVCYSIFVTMEDEETLDKLAKKVKEHTPYYTISLGLANLLGDIKFIAYEEVTKIEQDNFIEIDTAVKIENLKKEDPINLEKGITYSKERFVSSFKENREPEDFVDILYSLKAEKICVRAKEVYKLGDRNFTFL